MEEKIKKVIYTIYFDHIHIEESYKIKKEKEMRYVLSKIMTSENYKKYGYSRSMKSYLAEWKFHNFCYNLGFAKSHTAEVDFNKEFGNTLQEKLERIIYAIISIFIRK